MFKMSVILNLSVSTDSRSVPTKENVNNKKSD